MAKKNLFLILFLYISFSILAQTTDFGSWTNIKLEKKWNKWQFETELELRTQDKLQNWNRYSAQLEASYKILKPIELGIKYQYISFNDIEYSDIQARQRYAAYLQGKIKWGQFSFSLREQFMRTIKDERDRIRYSGEHDTYKVNPEWEWRNRLLVFYNIPDFKINPSIAFESFYTLNHPDQNTFNKLRFTGSLHYKLNKMHKFELFGLYDHEINVDNPSSSIILGLSYTFSFK